MLIIPSSQLIVGPLKVKAEKRKSPEMGVRNLTFRVTGPTAV